MFSTPFGIVGMGNGEMSLGQSHRGFAERELRYQQKREAHRDGGPVFAAVGGCLLGAIGVGLFTAVAAMGVQNLQGL